MNLLTPSILVGYDTAVKERLAMMRESISGERLAMQGRSEVFADDLIAWSIALTGRFERPLIDAAAAQYRMALLAIALGWYRLAFFSLRLFLELALGSIYYSTREFEYRKWASGELDSSWTAFTSPDSGPLSKAHVRMFLEPLAEESANYREIACKAYRECSEYVHGNMLTHIADSPLAFQGALFEKWHTLADAAALATSYALAARYTPILSPAALVPLESALLSQLGHISAIRDFFDREVER
ncbi:MAG: hypothetical protein QOC81_3729 [Thermoanaerobaculia bacterium]|jgi:hypothetical protein|nr:hypothetical protein [Thermoanaerobaculia bacterium]